MEGKEHVGMCGMHLCGKCALPTLIFGLLFLLTGAGVLALGAWWNGWTILGIYLALLGLMSMMKM